jgi:tripartite-type tricarboxylate transporter receptor subunit TctC
MRHTRAFRVIVTAVMAGGMFVALPSHAETNYPTRPITLVVPFGPGGSADVYARILGEKLQSKFGQSIVIENKPGAGAVIGTSFVARAQPDGYTLLVMSNTQTVNETLLKDKPYDLLKDFAPVAPINEASLVLVTNSKTSAKSINEIIEMERKSPGSLDYASSGIGTPYHIAGELFKSMTNTKAEHVPYKSSGQARTGVAAGEVDYMFDAVGTMQPMVTSGRVHALATTGRERSSVFPDVPTMDEAGVKGYTANIWLGVIAPKNTPKEVIAKLNAAISGITSSDDIKAAWAKDGVTPLVMSPEKFGEYLKNDVEHLREIAIGANMVAN